MNSYILIAILAGIVWTVRTLSGVRAFAPYFKYLPEPLWCYFLPTLLSTVGWIPQDAPIYGVMSKKLLPACLILMLVGTDLKAIIRLSPRALLAMFWGSVGIGIGGLVTYMLLFKTAIFPGADAIPRPWEA